MLRDHQAKHQTNKETQGILQISVVCYLTIDHLDSVTSIRDCDKRSGYLRLRLATNQPVLLSTVASIAGALTEFDNVFHN